MDWPGDFGTKILELVLRDGGMAITKTAENTDLITEVFFV